jgi:hypothetical protein
MLLSKCGIRLYCGFDRWICGITFRKTRMEIRFKTNFAQHENKFGNIKVISVYLCKQKNKTL